jgi:hypothetical protein
MPRGLPEESTLDDERASELAWQLAQLEAAPGDPHLFAREAALRRHLYWVLDQWTTRRRLQRCVNAAVSGRLMGELRLQRRQRALLQLGSDDSADLSEVQRVLFDTANFAERTWLGAGMSFETSAGFHAITDPIQQNRFARLVRRGVVAVSGPQAMAVKNFRQRRRAAYLIGLGVCAWMLLVLWEVLQQSEPETFFVVTYLSGTLLMAVWSTRQFLLDLRADIASVETASQGLRPRRVDSPSTTGKAVPRSR